MISQQVQQLKHELFLNVREISVERAQLYTESWQCTGRDHPVIRRAKATANILLKTEIAIRPGELLAGNRTVKPRSGMLSPETDPYWIANELDTLPTRPQDPFFISETDKNIYRNQLFPYWQGKSLKDYLATRLTPKVKEAQEANIFRLGQGHIIMNYQQVLAHGLDALLMDYELQHKNNPQNPFFYAALFVLAATACHIQRYAELAEQMAASEQNSTRRNQLLEMARISRKIAQDKPETFYEACQLFWFLNIVAQYESNASSISLGRFDQYMYPFYLDDIVKGTPVETIREILHCLWIKMNDVALLCSENSAKHFAGFPSGYTIILGGLDRRGRSAVNELSCLILDTYQDIHLPQPNVGIRINELTPQAFLNKTAEVIRLGTGITRIFNDEAIIPGFLLQGISLKEARDYAVVGCTGLSIPGKTYELYDMALFNLPNMLELTFNEKQGDFASFDALVASTKQKVDPYVALIADGSNIMEAGHREFAPTPFLSCFIDDCREKGQDVPACGARYNFSVVQGIGTANLSNSLYATKAACFDTEKLS